jgi:hypothetical protein
MATNRSYYTDGTDDPRTTWLQRTVRVTGHPEWGTARVMRWFPAGGGQPPRVRIRCSAITAPQIVAVSELERVE